MTKPLTPRWFLNLLEEKEKVLQEYYNEEMIGIKEFDLGMTVIKDLKYIVTEFAQAEIAYNEEVAKAGQSIMEKFKNTLKNLAK